MDFFITDKNRQLVDVENVKPFSHDRRTLPFLLEDKMRTGRPRDRVKKICNVCNVEFEVRRCRTATAKFCSLECRNTARFNSVERVCKCCHKVFIVYRERLERNAGHFCSNKCRYNSFALSGNPNWKKDGHKRLNCNGYIEVKMSVHSQKRTSGYCLEHRLIIEKNIGRILNIKEVVHHINGDKQDNKLENLILFKNISEHLKHHRRLQRESKN